MKIQRLRVTTVLCMTFLASGCARPLFAPAAPNLLHEGYTSATVEFRSDGPSPPLPLHAASSDPAMIQALLTVISKGSSDIACKCGDLGTVTLSKPGGEKFVFAVKPAHSQDDCQIAIGPQAERYAVNRKAFLAAVAPLGVPPERWIGR